jgi:hypothetical protein
MPRQIQGNINETMTITQNTVLRYQGRKEDHLYDTECLVIRVYVDLVSSRLTETAELYDVSEPLFSPWFAFPDHSFPNTLFAGAGVTLLPFFGFFSVVATSLTDWRELESLPDVEGGATPDHCSSSVVAVVAADMELPHEVPSSRGRRIEHAAAKAVDCRSRSKKGRTCTTTRRGSLTLCSPCALVSAISFLQPISAHSRFFSLFDRPGRLDPPARVHNTSYSISFSQKQNP